MRFKTEIKNVRTFSSQFACRQSEPYGTANPGQGLIAALNSLEKIAWIRLDDETVRFTVIPDTGSQVWACVAPPLLPSAAHD